MSEEDKALIRRIVDEFNRGNFTIADELFAPDFVDHSDPQGTPPGPSLVKERWRVFRTAFPDGQIRLEDMIAEGQKVVVRAVIRGTQTGEFMGIPPTGKEISVELIDINRFAAGKLVERWASSDQLGMLRQLGVITGT